MIAKKPYTPPLLYEVPLDQEQAILTACSLTTMNAAAGSGLNGCRANGVCESAMCGGSAGGCKRSSLALTCGGVTCHDSGVRAS
jgi:hypothetical protein